MTLTVGSCQACGEDSERVCATTPECPEVTGRRSERTFLQPLGCLTIGVDVPARSPRSRGRPALMRRAGWPEITDSRTDRTFRNRRGREKIAADNGAANAVVAYAGRPASFGRSAQHTMRGVRPTEPSSHTTPETSMNDTPWLASYPAGVRWNLDIQPAPVQQLLDDAVAKWPDRPAIEFMGKRSATASWARSPTARPRACRRSASSPACTSGLFLPQHAALHHRVLRRAQGRRHRGQLLAARRRQGARTQDRGQPHRCAVHARPRRALSADGRHARQDAAAEADRRQHGRDEPGARGSGGADEGRQATGRGHLGRSPHQLRPTARQRRPVHRLPGGRPDGNDRRAAVHRRHHRPAQGRDAHARQPVGSGGAVRRNDQGHPAGAGGGRRALPRRAAAVPHLRADGEHAVRPEDRCRGDPARPLRPQGRAARTSPASRSRCSAPCRRCSPR